jgi:Xaa-Pro aminopeptidase
MKTAGVLGRLGHGIGLTQPEPPSIWSEDETVVEAGMTVCVEPSFHDPKWGRLILEETVVVTPSGAELISDGTCADIRSI